MNVHERSTKSLGRGIRVAAVVLLAAGAGPATPPAGAGLHYRTLETENLRLVYYDEEHSYVVPYLARCFENSFRFHQHLFGYEPSEPVTVQLQDFDDYGYAGTTTIPYNFITIGIEPFDYVYDTCPTNERMNWVTSHELVHIVACDQASPGDRFFRKLFFGKVSPSDDDPLSMFYSYLTNPRFYAPRWYHEGIAVFLETWMAGGIGRAQSGYDEMVFRTKVLDGGRFYDVVGLESEGTTRDFQIGQNSYLYGTRFVSYLTHRYGPEKMIRWYRRSEGTRRYFSSQFREVYGTSLNDEWRRWVEWEHEWQAANIDSIRTYPVTPHRALSAFPFGSVSRSFLDRETGKLYAAIRYPGEFGHLAELDVATGRMRKVIEIDSPALYYVASLAHDPAGKRIFYTTSNAKQWRGLAVVDLRTGASRTLIPATRIGDLAFNRADQSLWGVQHHRGLSRIVRFPPPYNFWQEILVLPYGRDIYDLDISPDGKLLSASVAEVSGEKRLVLMEVEKLLSFDASYDVLWQPENIAPANFVFSEDGRRLYGTSYFTGVSNVYRYDLERREMEVLTNGDTGFFRPVPVSEDSLVVFRYTEEGFLPVMIPQRTTEDVASIRYLGQVITEAHPQIIDWMLPSPADVPLDEVVLRRGDYSGVRSMGFASVYPIVEGYKDYPAYGLRFNSADPAWIHTLNFAVSYSPDRRVSKDERLHLRFDYSHYPWTLRGGYNQADFYDLFGPTKSSRKGYALGLSYQNYLYYRGPQSVQYTLGASGYWQLERLPDYQNVSVTYDEFAMAHGSLAYNNLASTIGAIEAEKGVSASFAASATRVLSEVHPKAHADLTYGLLLPIDHSSLWLRALGGAGSGERDNPFVNFYFGGFGNNWVDHGSVNRYRSYYSFPGMELNAVGGRDFVKAMVEWTLPPLRFRRLGISSLYCNWIRLASFASGIVTNVDAPEVRRRLANAGVQANLKLVIFSCLESTLSAGYARAAEKGRGPEEEFMVSLKVLR
ncbi:MAG: hypothetical protein V1774_03695 [Candidatus Eisenbacteria bacterium]